MDPAAAANKRKHVSLFNGLGCVRSIPAFIPFVVPCGVVR